MEATRLRRHFFRRLRAVDELLQMFDLLPEVNFFIKDRRGRFIALNRRGCEYCGVGDESEAIGRTDHDFFPPSRADAYQADDVAVMDSGKAILNRIESAPEAEGSPRLVVTSKLPLRDEEGRVIGVCGISRQIERVQQATGSASKFARVVAHLHSHLEEPVSVPSLAKMAGLSVSHFERRFRRAFGITPKQFQLRVRVEEACRMLRETGMSAGEIALECGFHDHAHFCRVFKRQMRLSPVEFRRRKVKLPN